MNYIMDISYDGTYYEGYQKQPHGKTVQDTIEKALNKIFKTYIKTTASSRTDSGVHAKTQLVMFETPFFIEPYNLTKALNCCIDNSIIIKNITKNEHNKHVRYDVVDKTYEYIITKNLTPFNRNYAHYVKKDLDITKMQKAAKDIVGEHNFRSFCGSKANVSSYVRTVYYIKIEQIGDNIHIFVNGSGFLYNMVRIIVSTLIDIGSGSEINIKNLLKKEDRTLASVTAPAQGLYLLEINM